VAVKVYHAEKTLQLLDVLKAGGPRFYFGGMHGSVKAQWFSLHHHLYSSTSPKKVEGDSFRAVTLPI
jgi:uncharacterized protein YodC (DUF2158 family)